MEDVHISTDAPTTATPPGPKPAGSTPSKQASPIDQVKASAKKVLALISGRSSR
ncbi:MAG TPA: hypothetical protein VKS25_03600 [Solirubrobacteraceae bacterium]|nr:hypothetical protein [Solirubrobacteraceae bacterium]